jgi:hypothetical protein
LVKADRVKIVFGKYVQQENELGKAGGGKVGEHYSAS